MALQGFHDRHGAQYVDCMNARKLKRQTAECGAQGLHGGHAPCALASRRDDGGMMTASMTAINTVLWAIVQRQLDALSTFLLPRL